MQFRQLRYFVKIVEAGSFSKAAVVVHVAQPALSQQIAELEQRLGMSLLQRSARGVRPTAAGTVLYKEATGLLHQLDQLPLLIRSPEDEMEGLVNLGIAISLAPKVIGGLIEECRSTLPKVNIRLSDGDSLSLASKIASTALDLAIIYEDGLAAQVIRTPLFRQRLYVISATPLPEGKETITLQELADLPLVLPAPGNGRRDLIDRTFANAKLSHRVVQEADALSSEMWAVRNEVGCTILPVGDMSHFGPHAFVKPVLIEPSMHLTCSIVRSGNLPLSGAAEALHDCLLKFMALRTRQADMRGLEWISTS
jgi:LysR family nitrogen assimilation transcriptional regulator